MVEVLTFVGLAIAFVCVLLVGALMGVIIGINSEYHGASYKELLHAARTLANYPAPMSEEEERRHDWAMKVIAMHVNNDKEI